MLNSLKIRYGLIQILLQDSEAESEEAEEEGDEDLSPTEDNLDTLNMAYMVGSGRL